MNLRHKMKRIESFDKLFAKYSSKSTIDQADDLYFLVDLVNILRPKKTKKLSGISIESLLIFLTENPSHLAFLKDYLAFLLSDRKFSRLLSEAGILQNNDFISEVKKRIFAKILPFQPNNDTLDYVISQVFYNETDAIWVTKIPTEELNQLYDLLGFKDIYISCADKSPLAELISTMTLLSQRMSGRAMDSEVITMTPEYEGLESPFVAFEKELLAIFDVIRHSENHAIFSEGQSVKQLLILHKQCEEYVEKAFSNSSKFGISLKVNQSLLRIKQQLHRLKILLPLLIVDKPADKRCNTIQLALKLIKYNSHKNNVRQLIGESTQLVAYEITQHTAKTGEHYISETPREYFQMFKASAGGGLIVGILCVIKLLFSKVDTSDFGHAILYSLNYALGFITIYLLGFTLATKQPAMTASTIISALEAGMKKTVKNNSKHSSFAELFARLFRTQFIAFIGNVLIAFPVSLAIIWTIDFVFGLNIAYSKADKLLTDLSPIHSAAIFHAAIAGVFLFISGIISGSISNKNKYNNVYYRIQEHPFLKLTFGKEKAKSIAAFFENKWPGIVSNGWFGVFLGSTASLGIFLGLNLDIRHITFASGNFALALYGKSFIIDNWTIFWSVLGIGIIGFVNFIVSFSLSLGLAFRSRNIPLSELSLLFRAIWSHFKSYPITFFIPIKTNSV